MNSKELNELIHQNTRIILPEFGAFLVKDSREKGFNPSNISFSPFLRYNDGMLEVFVAKSRGISKEDAAKEIKEFVEFIKNELLEKGSYEIEGLGWLKRDQRGSLSFTLYQPDDKTTPSNKESAETIIKPEVEVKSTDEPVDAWLKEDKLQKAEKEPIKKARKNANSKAKVEKLTTTKTSKKTKVSTNESTSDPEIESAVDQNKILEVDPTTEEIVEQKNETKSEPIEEKASPIIEIPKEKETPQPIQIIEEIKPVINPVVGETKSQQIEKKEVKKSNISRFVYTFIAVILAVLIVLAIRSYYFPPSIESIDENIPTVQKPEKTLDDNKVKNENPKDEIEKAYNEVTKETESKEVVKQKEKENAQEEAIKNTIIQNAQVKNETKKEKTITHSGVKFYIIAGSFKKREFAEKYMDEINKSGSNATIVVQPSGMNAVSLGAYSTREDANEAVKKLKSKYPNLWILKK